MELNTAVSPEKKKEIAWRIVDEEAVLVLPDENKVKILNRTGTFIWELIDGKTTVGEIAGRIHDRYHVDPRTSLQHTLEFMEQLKTNNLIIADRVAEYED